MYNEKIRSIYLKIFEALYLLSFITIFVSYRVIDPVGSVTYHYFIFFYFIIFIVIKFSLDDILYFNKKLIYFVIYNIQNITFSFLNPNLGFILIYLSLVGIFVCIILIYEKNSVYIHAINIIMLLVFYYINLSFNDVAIFSVSIPFFVLLGMNLYKINSINYNIINELSTTDDLTGLLNQSGFMKKIEEEFYRSQRYGKRFSVLMVDSDNLKAVNDTYGHKYGSMVIVSIAETIRDNIRRSDFAARYGGDEFIICLVETDIDGAMDVAERIRKQFELKSFFTKDDKKFMLTLSIGVSSYPKNGETLLDVLDNADKALYKSKNLGKNRTSCLLNN